jgi:hypothetical protein
MIDIEPLRENYPSAYWFWHNIPSRNEILRQVAEMSHAGFHAFFIQPRLSFPREKYLSDEYLAAYREAVIAAKETGLDVGIYDDFNWISGHAGGKTVQGRDDLREQHLFWSSGQALHHTGECSIHDIHSLMIEGLGPAGMEWCYEDSKVRWDQWQIFHVLGYTLTGGQPSDVQDITQYCSLPAADESGCRVHVNLPDSFPAEMRFTAMVHARCISSRLINYLNPDAVNRYIEVDYEPYARTIGEFFGDPVKYMFFDHPYCGFYGWAEHEGNIGNSLMYTDRLPVVFEKEHGYPMETALLSFILPENTETPKHRADFFDTYGRLGRSTFFGTLSRWTKAHGLGLAGHELLGHVGGWDFVKGFPYLDIRTNFAADYFDIDSYRTVTTVDACNFKPQLSARMGDSVAKAHGRKGCLIEQYTVSNKPGIPGAAGQWGLTPETLRAQAIRHELFGTSQFIFHAFYQTDGSEGDFTWYKNPRFDFPPGINFEPWFKSHSKIAVELADLSAFIARSEPANRIAILYPLATWWVGGSEHPFATHSAFWARWLSEHGYGFDFISEEQLQAAKIHDGRLETGSQSYSILILPGVNTVKKVSTVEKISSFSGNGGTLVASGPMIDSTQETGRDDRMAQTFRALVMNLPGVQYSADFPQDADISSLFSQKIGNIPLIGKIEGVGDPVWAWTGKDAGEPCMALFNDAALPRRVQILLPGGLYRPFRFNWESHQMEPWDAYEMVEKGTSVPLDMQPQELALLTFGKTSPDAPHLISADSFIHSASIGEQVRLVIEMQPAGSDLIHLDIASIVKPSLASDRFTTTVQKAGPSVWKVEVQPKTLPEPISLEKDWIFHAEGENVDYPILVNCGWEKQGFAAYSGVGVYKSEFCFAEGALAWDWVLDLPGVETTAEVWINGQPVGEKIHTPYRFVLKPSQLLPRMNRILIEVTNTGANHYYDHTPYQGDQPAVSGLTAAPVLRPLQNIRIIA